MARAENSKSTRQVYIVSFLKTTRWGSAHMTGTFAERVSRSSCHVGSTAHDCFLKSSGCHTILNAWSIITFYSLLVMYAFCTANFPPNICCFRFRYFVLNTVHKQRVGPLYIRRCVYTDSATLAQISPTTHSRFRTAKETRSNRFFLLFWIFWKQILTFC